jgi:hypothetical protein
VEPLTAGDNGKGPGSVSSALFETYAQEVDWVVEQVLATDADFLVDVVQHVDGAGCRVDPHKHGLDGLQRCQRGDRDDTRKRQKQAQGSDQATQRSAVVAIAIANR